MDAVAEAYSKRPGKMLSPQEFARRAKYTRSLIRGASPTDEARAARERIRRLELEAAKL